MSDFVQPVKDGQVQQTKSSTTDTKPKSELDKNAFLQLLTTQMKYQDPLNPSTDTQYIAQLATFSQLEQMQNLSQTTANSQAFSLVGKDVTVKSETATGGTNYISGKVDYVVMSGTNAQLSINGVLYPADKLDSVISDDFITKQNLPGVLEKTTLSYDAGNPKDLTLGVKMGAEDSVADDVRIVINDNVVDPKYVSVSGNKVTVKKEALADLENGSYKVYVAFNDPAMTTVKDMVTLQVANAATTDDTTGDTAGDTADGSTGTDSTDTLAEDGEA